MEIRINKDRVSHIVVKDYRKENYIWREKKYVTFLWLFKDLMHKEGYWKNGEQLSWSWSIPKEELGEYNFIDREGTLWERPYIKIYCGSEVIKLKYFDDIRVAKKYCDDNFPNVNVILN